MGKNLMGLLGNIYNRALIDWIGAVCDSIRRICGRCELRKGDPTISVGQLKVAVIHSEDNAATNDDTNTALCWMGDNGVGKYTYLYCTHKCTLTFDQLR